MKSCMMLAVLGATALSPMAAQATTVLGDYAVTAAVSDRNGKSLSVWLERVVGASLSSVYTIDTPGTFSADSAGGQLDATTQADTGAAGGFAISMSFDRDFSGLAFAAPVFKDVFGSAVSPPAVEHGNEDYFDLEFGSLMGTGGLAGLNFGIVRAPASGEFATQVGGGILADIGANQHNSNFGASGWFTISSVALDRATCILCSEDDAFYDNLVGTQGDINVDLLPASVPLPAAGLMLLGALGGMGAISKRRRKS